MSTNDTNESRAKTNITGQEMEDSPIKIVDEKKRPKILSSTILSFFIIMIQ